VSVTLERELLEPGAPLRGIVSVTTPSGSPVRGARVSVTVGDDAAAPIEIVTSAEGLARIDAHAPRAGRGVRRRLAREHRRGLHVEPELEIDRIPRRASPRWIVQRTRAWRNRCVQSVTARARAPARPSRSRRARDATGLVHVSGIDATAES
jgi:hypothetical protein